MRTRLTASVVWIALTPCFIAEIGAFPACAQDAAGVVPAIRSVDETAPNTASHFGIVFREYFPGRQPVFNPKLSHTATKTANELLLDYNFMRRIDEGKSEDWILEFKDAAGRLTVLAWTSGESHSALIALRPDTYEVISYLGEKLSPITAGPDGLTIRLADAPQYLRPKTESADANAALASSRCST